MEVNGRQVDVLQWLRETGGKNAIKRFAPQADTDSTATEKPSDRVTLSAETTALLKAQMQYSKAGLVVPSTAAGIYSGLSNASTIPPSSSLPTAQRNEAETNTVQFSTSKTNSAKITGSHNAVDFRANDGLVRNNTVSLTGDNNLVRGYNGGQKNDELNITGDTNRVYAGQNVANTAVTIRGGENTVNLSTDASNNAINVTGNNVKVSIGSAGQTAGSNQNWKVSVSANNVDVAIVNGKAEVKMSEELQSKYKVTVDNAAKTVEVAAI